MRKIVVATMAVLLGACTGSSHLSNGYGRSFRSSWRAQHAAEGQQPKPAVKGLDSEEATIVASSYRTSLAPKGAKGEEPEILYVAPPQRGDRQTKLAPSVPTER